MLTLPYDDLTDPVRLADWLELCALVSPDHNSSRGDLGGALRTASLSELGDDYAVERKELEVFAELEDRTKACERAYPFGTDCPGLLQVKPGGWQAFPVYVFCLCLSYYPLTESKVAPKLFERISCLAASSYLHGQAVGFGSPRSELPASFADAVARVCQLMGEGGGYRTQPSLSCKDDTLDLVAWRDFADLKTSKILMFGQCGAGKDWSGKLGELDPNAFWRQWMRDGAVSPEPLKSFFTPYRIRQCQWDHCARKAGVLFDRCRIAYWAHQELADHARLMEWTGKFLQGLCQ